MQKAIRSVAGLAVAWAAASCSVLPSDGGPLAKEDAGATPVNSIEFSGTGKWFQFGQAPNPDQPWPPFAVKNYTADIHYDEASAHVQITRSQIVEPGRNRPVPVEQKIDQYIKGGVAWNVAATANVAPTPTPQPAAVEERNAEIWATPQGFLKASLKNQAVSKTTGQGTEVSFTVDGKYRYIGLLNAQHQLAQVQTWIDNPVLGDTLIETRYSDYRDFSGVQFPGHIVRTQGSYPVLDISVTDVKLNPASAITTPQEAVKAPEIVVTPNKLAKGVYYLTGGTHHSVAIGQKDHVVVVEAPQFEARSEAVINKVKDLFPGKPIRYLINTHAHFDHAGGLRTFVDEGATIVTQAANKAYFEKVWAAPRTINPDRLAKSQKPAEFISFNESYTLTDGKRPIEIHSIAGNGHNDAFVLVYLPKEKVLIEADAYTPLAANAPKPAKPNPYSVNLYENIQKLHLQVGQIAALHGPRVVKLADLQNAIGL